MLAAIGRPLEGSSGADQEEILAEELAASDRDGGGRSADLAGVVTESQPAAPGVAAWLSQQVPAGAAGRDLAGPAAEFRKVASCAQAGELAMVAQVAARSAERDEKIGLAEDGRPAWVSRETAAQVSLELALSPCGGEAWAQLAVTLQWRLPAAAALATGAIDLCRTKVIAEATTALSQEAARAVEAKILPAAGDMTYAQLRAAVRRAVIAADPEGAEQAARNGNAEVRQSRLRQLDGMAQLTAAPRSSHTYRLPPDAGGRGRRAFARRGDRASRRRPGRVRAWTNRCGFLLCASVRSWWLIQGHAARLSSRRARWLVRRRSSGVPAQ